MLTRLAAPLALIALAAPVATAGEVNIYSYRQPELIAPLTDAFTRETGITINTVFLDKGMIERLKAEGELSPADLIFTVDISRLTEAVEAGVTQPVVTESLRANVPAEFRDEAGHWYGITARARVAYASRERVAPGEVTTYEDLADPKWRGRICTRSGTHAYTLGLLGAMVVKRGEAAAEAWMAGLRANLAKKPEGNDRGQVKSVWAGECDIALGNTYYMVAMLADDEQRAWAEAVRIDFPVFEGGGTHMNVSGVAMTKAAPNRENALRMMEWLTSDEAQTIYAEIVGEYPVKPGLKPSALVQGFGAFTPDDLPLSSIGAARPVALKIVERIGFND